ncbi:unnamed protein product, partial [Didymodactylos carnosus]
MASMMDSKPKMSTVSGHGGELYLFLIDFVTGIDGVSNNVKDNCRRFHKCLTDIFDAHEIALGQIQEKNRLAFRTYFAGKNFELNMSNENSIEWKNFIKYLHNEVPKSYSVEHYADVYPLLLHVSSISAGIVFNYYYSYMIKQARTNNIYLKITFEQKIVSEKEFILPKNIQIQLVSEIESFYMHEHKIPTDKNRRILSPNNTESRLLTSNKLDMHYDKLEDGKAVYAATAFNLATGISDFGSQVQELYVWYGSSNAGIKSISMLDDVREWNEHYVVKR